MSSCSGRHPKFKLLRKDLTPTSNCVIDLIDFIVVDDDDDDDNDDDEMGERERLG
ncbi:hypothetical protein RUM44_013317 [Polyplax serrata]|uniref:Uncharacterized protein n=1 Tax=Polyplax serrata TaxID=468196 RepID=A0ABR1BE66_POLSC